MPTIGADQERRAYPRVRLRDRVEVHVATGGNDCRLVDISGGGALIESRTYPPIGDAVMLRLRDVGQLKATVVRHVPDGFAVAFDISQETRDRLLAHFEAAFTAAREAGEL